MRARIDRRHRAWAAGTPLPQTMGAQLAPVRAASHNRQKDSIMAIDAHEGGHRPEPGLGLALLTVLVMVLTTAVLSGLIYLLMLGVAATSSGQQSSPVEQPAVSTPATPPASTPIAPATK